MRIRKTLSHIKNKRIATGIVSYTLGRPEWCTNNLSRKFSYRPVSDVIMHSNKITGPQWRIYSKTVITFELVLDFVIWKIVPCD